MLCVSQGTNEATEKLREEWEMMKMLNEQNSQFTAGPSANDLYHWLVSPTFSWHIWGC